MVSIVGHVEKMRLFSWWWYVEINGDRRYTNGFALTKWSARQHVLAEARNYNKANGTAVEVEWV